MSGDFLSRWSRRKQQARRAEPEPEPEAVEPVEALRPELPKPIVGEPALSSEEIAELPKIEALTAESDISGFLRKGVPDALRNAALRRMWSLDPAIRDFPGHARDYAYDWNSPGGVPGTGPLSVADDVQGMVSGVFGEPPPADEARPATTAELSRDRDGSSPSPPSEGGPAEAVADAAQQKQAFDREPARSPFDADDATGEMARADGSAPHPTPADDHGGTPQLRRHGGAKPL